MTSSRAVSTWRQPASFAKDLAFKQRGLENAQNGQLHDGPGVSPRM